MRIFRETLTAIATLFVLALIAAMVAPGFIDWNPYRERIAALVTERTGVPVRIDGDLRLSILPVPEFDAEKVVVGPIDAPVFKADRLTASFALTSLIGATPHVTAARGDGVMLAPHRLGALAKGSAGANAIPGAKAGRAGIDRLDLRQVTLLSPEGETSAPRISGLEIVLEAPQLSGPFRLDILDPGQARDLRAQIGKIEGGRARVKALLEEKRLAFRATFDGALGVPDGSARPLFDGQVLFHGNPLLGSVDDAPQVPVNGSARLVVTADQAVLDPVNIAIGGEDALSLAGRGFIDATRPRHAMTLDLAAKRLDLATLRPREGTPETTDHADRAARALTKLAEFSLPFDLALSVEIGTIQGAEASIGDARAKLAVDSVGSRLESASAKLPGTSDFSYERQASATSAFLEGHTALNIGELATFVGWLRNVDPPADLPPSLTLTGGVMSHRSALMFRDVAIVSEAGALRGTAQLDLPVPGTRTSPHLGLDLAADRFDARMLAAIDPFGGRSTMEASAKLDIASLILEGQAVGGLSVAVERDNQRTSLQQLRLRGSGGEELTLSGSSSGGTTILTGKLDAERLEALTRLVQAIAPGRVADALAVRAQALSPALAVANLRIETPRSGDAVWDIQLEGKLGGSSAKLRTRSNIAGPDLTLGIDGEISNDDGAKLLAQLGGSALARAPSLPGKLLLKAEGNPRRMLRGTLEGQVAGVELKADGTLNPFRQPAPLEGRVRIESGDISVLHRALGGGAPEIPTGTRAEIQGRYFVEAGPKLTLTAFAATFGANRIGGEISFDFARGGQVAGQLRMGAMSLATLLAPALGRKESLPGSFAWPRDAFTENPAPMLSGDLWIEGQALHLTPATVLRSPQFVLRFAPGLVAIEGFEGALGEAQYRATVSLGRRAGQIDATGRVEFQRVALPGVQGRISGEVPFTASGETAFALVSSLGGAGHVTVENLTLPETDATALTRVAAKPLDDFGAIDENRIGNILDAELRKGRLSFPPLRFPLTLLNGQLRLGGSVIDPRLQPVRGLQMVPALTLDLPRGALDARLSMRLSEAPPGWRGAPPEVALGWVGRIGDSDARLGVRRQLTVAPLVNGLLAMSLQRDLERAEAFEADVRERAALLRRQKADAFMARRQGEIAAFERAELDRLARAAIEAERLAREAEEQERKARAAVEAARRAAEAEAERRAQEALRREQLAPAAQSPAPAAPVAAPAAAAPTLTGPAREQPVVAAPAPIGVPTPAIQTPAILAPVTPSTGAPLPLTRGTGAPLDLSPPVAR